MAPVRWLCLFTPARASHD